MNAKKLRENKTDKIFVIDDENVGWIGQEGTLKCRYNPFGLRQYRELGIELLGGDKKKPFRCLQLEGLALLQIILSLYPTV
jgi:hypothetical protein